MEWVATMNVAPMDVLLPAMELPAPLDPPKGKSNSFPKLYSYIKLRLMIM